MGAARGRTGALRARPLSRVATHRTRPRLPRLRGGLALVDLRSRGVLGVDLGLLRRSLACTLRAGARLARDARRRVVPGGSAELRRAHAWPGRGRRRGGGRRVLADARADGAHVRRPQGAGRARADGPASGSASGPATGSSPICRTSRRRSSRSSQRRVSAPSGQRARRSSVSGAFSIGSGSSSRRCFSPSRAIATARSSSIGASTWPRSEQVWPAWRPSSTCRTSEMPTMHSRTPCPGTRSSRRASHSRSSRCRSRTRSTCCSPPARPACRRRSCTATAASCSST